MYLYPVFQIIIDGTFPSLCCTKIRHQHVPIIKHVSTSGAVVIHPKARTRCSHKLLVVRHMTSDAGNGNDSDSGSGTKSGGNDKDNQPVCPRCKEPFTDTFSSISK